MSNLGTELLEHLPNLLKTNRFNDIFDLLKKSWIPLFYPCWLKKISFHGDFSNLMTLIFSDFTFVLFFIKIPSKSFGFFLLIFMFLKRYRFNYIFFLKRSGISRKEFFRVKPIFTYKSQTKTDKVKSLKGRSIFFT